MNTAYSHTRHTTDKKPCVIRDTIMTSARKETLAFPPQDDLGKLSYAAASCVRGQHGCSSTCSKRNHRANQELSRGQMCCRNSSDLLSSQRLGNHSDLQHSSHCSALQMLFCRQGKRTDFTPRGISKNPTQRDKDAPEAEIMEQFKGLLLGNSDCF